MITWNNRSTFAGFVKRSFLSFNTHNVLTTVFYRTLSAQQRMLEERLTSVTRLSACVL